MRETEHKTIESMGRKRPTSFNCDRLVTKNKAIFNPTLKKIMAFTKKKVKKAGIAGEQCSRKTQQRKK